MSEQLKYIVQELNKAPLNKSYNLISFDGLEPLQLIQNLNDICSEVESKVYNPAIKSQLWLSHNFVFFFIQV